MKNNLELMMINDLINERNCELQLRAKLLKQMKGLKYWLYLLGF